MKKREFNKYSRKDKIWVLYSCLNLALLEFKSKRYNKLSNHIYGIATQYNSILKKSDFDLIKNMTIDEIVEELK